MISREIYEQLLRAKLLAGNALHTHRLRPGALAMIGDAESDLPACIVHCCPHSGFKRSTSGNRAGFAALKLHANLYALPASAEREIKQQPDKGSDRQEYEENIARFQALPPAGGSVKKLPI